MSTGSIRLITTQKVLKTWSVEGVNQNYSGSNQYAPHGFQGQQQQSSQRVENQG